MLFFSNFWNNIEVLSCVGAVVVSNKVLLECFCFIYCLKPIRQVDLKIYLDDLLTRYLLVTRGSSRYAASKFLLLLMDISNIIKKNMVLGKIQEIFAVHLADLFGLNYASAVSKNVVFDSLKKSRTLQILIKLFDCIYKI